jgi:hypothetical protein
MSELSAELLTLLYLWKYRLLAGCWWFMPVILGTKEAEIRKITVQSQPRQTVCETLSQKINHKKWLVEWLKV